MKKKDEIKVCLVGSSGGHLTHLYMLKPFWKDKDHFWVTFDKEDVPQQPFMERPIDCKAGYGARHRICAGADLQYHRQPLSQPETADRYHEPDPDGVEEPAGYRTRPYL